ncbi:MAG: hypothetical protein HFJ80_06510 [Clostridiales bacterium]|nr:hypothetical protein [Clostridiales bacterium]
MAKREKPHRYKVRLRTHPLADEAAQKSASVMGKQGRGEIVSDVLGSYTGSPEDGLQPEQDADDL